MDYQLREMTLTDYDDVFKLWKNTEHVSLNECDSREGTEFYLRRNPGLCFVAHQEEQIIGSVLCGHDGRRGFLRHLAVAKAYRGSGVARALVDKVLEGLARQGVGKCNIFVEDGNLPGFAFWEHLGWAKLDDKFRTLQKLTH